MNQHTEMPTISFSSDATYDTMHSILENWCVRVWLTDGVILTALWKGENVLEEEDGTALLVWNEKRQDYVTAMVVPTDNIRKIEVL